jgi:hypothetical protein
MLMGLRFDKVIRVVALGVRRVYSLVLTDDGLYLIQTGHIKTLKHYRRDEQGQVVATRADDRGVQDLQARESQIDPATLDGLAKIKDNYFIRLEAIEDVELKPGKTEPDMWIGVTGSEHHLFFPLASYEEVETLQRALSKWLAPR